MSKRVETDIPVQAETEAINWAVPQLVSHNIHKTIVESDAKSNCKEPNIAQKDYRAVEVTEKKEVPAAMWFQQSLTLIKLRTKFQPVRRLKDQQRQLQQLENFMIPPCLRKSERSGLVIYVS